MIAGAAPSTPEQQQRVRRLVLTMVLGESPLIIAGVVCYILTENWLYFGLCIGLGIMIGLFAVVRFAVQAQRSAEGEISVAQSAPTANPPIVE